MLQSRATTVTWVPGEFEGMVVHLLVGCAVAVVVFRLVTRVPWPRRLHWRFVALHLVAAPLATALWLAVSLALGTLVGAASDISLAKQIREMMVIGGFFYAVIAGLAYSADGARRAARAEAAAAQTQLATLRSQLQPHFLFNSLHTIVQLIHIDAQRASDAAELVAELLRRTLEEQRDEVPLGDEWKFVSQYLAIEEMRFGDRLRVNIDIPHDLKTELVPSFALQTLVENAVQHGAAPRAAPTTITVRASRGGLGTAITVANDGEANVQRSGAAGTGTGLARLRERLSVLYGNTAVLVTKPVPSGGYESVLTIPRKRAGSA
jgi:two-component system LytT family sensor kinase